MVVNSASLALRRKVLPEKVIFDIHENRCCRYSYNVLSKDLNALDGPTDFSRMK